MLAISATLFYVFVYTLWLKRRSTQNIVIGGAAGAVPVLVGWAAVTNCLAWAPVVMFAIIFIWTPPHFWSLAVRYKEDYKAADVPMLPVVASMKRTTTEIVYYTVALVAVTFLFGPVAHLGWIYMITAAVLGAGFLYLVTRLWGLAQNGQVTGREAMRVFGYSITYLTVLFVAMAGDVLISSVRSLTSPRDDRRSTTRSVGVGRRRVRLPVPAPRKPRKRFFLVAGHRRGRRTRHRAVHQRRHQSGYGVIWRAAAARRPGAVVQRTQHRSGGATTGGRARPRGRERGRPPCSSSSATWCASCHQELPPLAAAVHQQGRAAGALSKIHVIGVDSEDTTSNARSFIKSSGVTFPVAYDPNVTITEGTFDFHGDPYTVFVRGNGTIGQVVPAPC